MPADAARAAWYYGEACETGTVDGCGYYGRMLAQGRGVEADIPRAVDMLKRACHEKSAVGCDALGFLHQSGTGVDQDLAEAGRLFRKALALDPGFYEAQVHLDNLVATP